MWREDEEEDVSSYWVALRKWDYAGNWMRKRWMAFCGELSLEEAVKLSKDRRKMNEYYKSKFLFLQAKVLNPVQTSP
jgi:hypothetical protein